MKIHNDFTLYWRVFPSGKRVVYYYAYDTNGWYVSADRGYDRDPFRWIVQANNTIPVIPGRRSA